MKIAILGAGNMATAFASICPSDSKVCLYTIEKDVYDDITSNHSNSKYAKISLSDNISCSMDLNECLKDAKIIVFSIPSFAVEKLCIQIKGMANDDLILMCLSKGLNPNNFETMSQIISRHFKNPLVSISGPCIANELMEKSLTFALFSSIDEKFAVYCKKIFENDYYKISVSKNVFGDELCSVLKNAYAIGVGYAKQKGFGINARAGLISKYLEEMAYICEKMNADKSSAYSLAGIGDLIATSLSIHGRNRRFGELLAQGKSNNEAKAIIGQVVEGENSLAIFKKIIEGKKINAPLFENIHSIVFLNRKELI